MTKMIAAQLAVFVAVGVLWAASVHFVGISDAVLPQITDVGAAAFELLFRDEFWPSVWLTVRDAFTGLCIAMVLGVTAGILIGTTPFLDRSTRLIVDFGRSFPQVALIPVFLLVFGAASSMKILLIAVACFFPVLLQTIYGARKLNSTLTDTVSAYRIPALLKYRRVILPAASPYIMTGARIAVILSILVAIAVEITSPISGMGRELAKARDFYETDVAIAYALYAGLLGVVVNMLADRVEKSLLGWHLRSLEAS